jgi:protein-L-isoaspartate(D-aspartate) O-methyltransferase
MPVSWVLLALALGAAGEARAAAEDGAERPAFETSARQQERERMVAEQFEARGVRDARVLAAMRTVPRHEFVPAAVVADAYADRALPIRHDSRISQPYVVAVMTEQAALRPGARVLEVGTGSGYQAAVLAAMGCDVYTIEIVAPLAHEAEERLRRLGFSRERSGEIGGVLVRAGDGYRGWPEAAPFDAVIVTAAAPRTPQPLLEQLAVGGRLVIPVDVPDGDQELQVHERTADGFDVRRVFGVRFIPMTGEVRGSPPRKD